MLTKSCQWIIVVLWMVSPINGNRKNQVDLYENLFSTYNLNVRPVVDPKIPTNVSVMFFITSFEISAKYQEIEIRGWFIFDWKDGYLTWNQGEYSTAKLILRPSLVWLPDLTILNAKKDRAVVRKSISPVEITPYGNVTWKPEVTMTTSCPISVRNYPFDTQVCDIQLSTWYSEPHEQTLDTTMDEIPVVSLETSAEWEYVSSSIKTEPVGSKRQSGIKFKITIKRRPSYQIVHTFIPTVLLSYMNCFVFILPINSGETTSFGVAIFLAFAVFIGPVKESLPVTSTETCLFTVYMISQFCLGGVETCLSSLTLRLAAKTTIVNSKSWWIVLWNLLLIRKQRNEKVYPEISQIDSQVGHDTNEEVDKLPHTDKCQDKPITVDVELDWMDLGSRLNTLLFFMFVVIKTVCLLWVLINIMS